MCFELQLEGKYMLEEQSLGWKVVVIKMWWKLRTAKILASELALKKLQP